MNREITLCPYCGSFHLKAHAKNKEISLKGIVNDQKQTVKEYFTLGPVNAWIAATKRDLQYFKTQKFWVCDDCGYSFPMN